MKYFLEMIEHAKTHEIHYWDDKKQETWDKNSFFSLIDKCQPFVFTISNETPAVPEDGEGNTIYKKLDAPFAVFSVEMLDYFTFKRSNTAPSKQSDMETFGS